jgi:hypothetical protein
MNHTYRGRDINELSRDEAIEALAKALTIIKQNNSAYIDTIDLLGMHIRSTGQPFRPNQTADATKL